MNKFRLFVGNLAPSVSEEELKDKFGSLLSSHPEAELGQVEVRCKNNDNFFAFVDVHVKTSAATQDAKPPPYLFKSIDLMNNTKWKGCLIKVQLAKESFLDKLKRERETQARAPREVFRPRPNDNFDFEIVQNGLKKKKGEADENSEEEEEEDTSPDGIPKFKGLLLSYPNGLPESNLAQGPANPHIKNQNEANPELKDPVDPEQFEINEKMKRLQRIAGYSAVKPNHNAPASTQRPAHLINQRSTQIIPIFPQQKIPVTLNNAAASIPPIQRPIEVAVPSQSKGVVFKKSKQINSDLLRQQSIDKRMTLQSHQASLIKSSLSNAQMQLQENSAPSANKKKKIDLFAAEEDEDNENEDSFNFKVKSQFEGHEGQRLLALKGQWGNDDRFKIDARFKEDLNIGGEEPNENAQERQTQLNILNALLGTSILPEVPSGFKGNGHSSDNFQNSVILQRYDPDDAPEETFSSSKGESKINPKAAGLKKGSETGAEPEEPIRSTEPASYKTVSNLKSLFSHQGGDEGDGDGLKKGLGPAAAEGSSTFSLLATFGAKDNQDSSSFPLQTSKKSKLSSSEAPRQFWENNPFKYDSSDDEEEQVDDKKLSKKGPPSIPFTLQKQAKDSNFFFRKNDLRFIGLWDYFAAGGEGGTSQGVERIDYDETRKELKSIVKAKARNAKRKDEKRTLAIKRAIRKKKKYQKTIVKKGSGNFSKLGQT